MPVSARRLATSGPARQVAVADHRNRNGRDDFADHVPIRRPGITLRTRAAMDREGENASLLENARDLRER